MRAQSVKTPLRGKITLQQIRLPLVGHSYLAWGLWA